MVMGYEFLDGWTAPACPIFSRLLFSKILSVSEKAFFQDCGNLIRSDGLHLKYVEKSSDKS